MNAVLINIPEIQSHQVKALRAVPFAKTDQGYQFADWIYELNKKEGEQKELLASEHGKEAAALIQKAVEDLKAVTVTEDDYAQWTIYKKETGGVILYHEILKNLKVSMFLLAVPENPAAVRQRTDHTKEKDLYGWRRQESSVAKKILNRNNPFSDISIKSQQFFYKTEDGATETLCFDTNHIVEKADRNGQSLFTMRPSFQVSREHGVVKKSSQKVVAP